MLFDFLVSGTPPSRTDRHRLGREVTVDGVPASRLVVVLDRVTLTLVAAKMSDPTTGIWEFSGLPQYDERRLLVMALDNTGNYNAEVADYVSQVAS